MIFSDAQAEIVHQLMVPLMGTDTMAPLLHFLARFTRAQHIVEAGAGYTTPFLAMALAKNMEAFESETHALQQKTGPYIAECEAIIESDCRSRERRRPGQFDPLGMRALYADNVSRLTKRRLDWLSANPSWARPGYYLSSCQPQLLCIDDFSNPSSSARQVQDVTGRVGLSEFVTFVNGDFWRATSESLPEEHWPIDMIWIDVPTTVRDVIEFFEGHYWQCLRPNGLLIIHDVMTTRGGQLILDELKWQQTRTNSELELVGLMQPHRLIQGDCVLIRKTDGKTTEPVDDIIVPPGRDVLEDEAQLLLELDTAGHTRSKRQEPSPNRMVESHPSHR